MNCSSNTVLRAAGAIIAAAFAVFSPALRAQTVASAAPVAAAPAAEPANSLQEVVVTGTRQSGIEAAESPAPILILSPQALATAEGSPDLMATLAQIVPSLQMSAFGFDMANQTLQARLKGLSPNHVLVLINGKRRHNTANIAIDGGNPYQGGASADLGLIPQAAIDHIEVLTEGAAAQYGSDAIAGVINIILKKNSSGGSVTGLYGADYDGGPQGSSQLKGFNGTTNKVTGNIGFEPFDGAYLNLSGEIHNHGHTFQGAADPRVSAPYYVDGCGPGNTAFPVGGSCNLAKESIDANTVNVAGYPYLNLIQGDAESHSKLAAFNAGVDLGGGSEFYAFGTYGSKWVASNQNYRLPRTYNYTDPVTGVTYFPLPNGFWPLEGDQEIDFATTIGVSGMTVGWNWDLSSTYGADHHDVYTLDSINPAEFEANGLPITCVTATGAACGHGFTTPINYFAGLQFSSQWTTNFDVNHDWNVGMASPLNTAAGVEFRRDEFQIGAGEPNSYILGGPSSWAGFSPQDQGVHLRTNEAVYVDLAGKPIDPLRIDLAGRYEHYSDFGDATVGKLTARYDFAPEFAMRGTISNGFRAPTLEEEYYTSTNVGPSSVFAQFAPNAPSAAVLGLGKLQPEKSSNLSLGLIWRPLPAMSTTLDLYHIRVTNRIFGSGDMYGLLNGAVTSSLINDAISGAGTPINPDFTTTGITMFVNSFNTSTNGADLAFQFPVDYSFGHINWQIDGTMNATSVTYIRPTPAQLLPSLAGGVSLFNPQTISDVTEASPKFVLNLSLNYTYDKLSVNILEKIYGASHEWENDDADNATNSLNWYKTTIGVSPITNIDINYNITKALKVGVGANNAFNRYPGLLNPALLAAYNSPYGVNNNDAAGAAPVPIFSPFGIDGGFWYGTVSYTF